MNILDIIEAIVNIVTIPVALITVILLIRQTKQLDETLKSQVYQGLIDNSLKIDTFLIENPQYRRYVYDNAEFPEDSADLDKLWGVLDFVLDIVDNVKAQEKYIPKASLAGWRAFTELILKQPSIRYYLEKKYGFWFEGTLVNSQIKSFEKRSANNIFQKGTFRILPQIFKRKNREQQESKTDFVHVVKSYISPKAIMKPSGINGLGTFAKTEIRKGEVVFVKGGHIVTRDIMYSTKQIDSYLPISDDLFIGAICKEEEEGIKLFVNHSCEPNCGLRGDITFVAVRDICAGEELTFDYAMVDNEYYEFECSCESPNCRGKVTGFDWKIKKLQKKYGNHFASYLLEKIISQKSKITFTHDK